MIKSMTGFSSLTHEDELATIIVTIRGFNHRHLDVQLKLPPQLHGEAGNLRAHVRRRIGRGRVELTVELQIKRLLDTEVELNEPFVEALAAAIERARDRGFVVDGLSASDVLRFHQALVIRDKSLSSEEAEAEKDAVVRAVETVTEATLVDFDAMRQQEGQYLAVDLEKRHATLVDLIERISSVADEGNAALEQRIEARIAELKLEVQLEPSVITQEVVRIVAKNDISEELTRFRGHLAHWELLANTTEPCGRKLDFLLQEMNREINTIGSKAEGVGIADLIVTGKSELEKMREQLQNVE